MFGPSRKFIVTDDGNYLWTITPPAWSGFGPSTITLTHDQHERAINWITGKILIQDALPELSSEQREMLLSGISPREWEDTVTDKFKSRFNPQRGQQ